ncbi:hypothetical protein SAMN05660648_02735 [Selenomonas ruminantium]|uniref:Uncharacterized protein n=1 Tax=Selenomonas ruminantium TaxID=971 RepID=A0A1H4A6C6_SELRU|nr:hypothetical protein SAMN05660648_02735 [Selenomonas ruminantium]
MLPECPELPQVHIFPVCTEMNHLCIYNVFLRQLIIEFIGKFILVCIIAVECLLAYFGSIQNGFQLYIFNGLLGNKSVSGFLSTTPAYRSGVVD